MKELIELIGGVSSLQDLQGRAPVKNAKVKRVGSSPRSSLALIYPACCKIQLGRMEPYMYRLQSRDLSFCMKP